ncbi:MAG: glycosyltransferase [Dehalococcoidia bacterium]|jgi:cellulose synthase/poly-beta-1,6-N-acetylglucosamine synthase-like glycosyltransferase
MPKASALVPAHNEEQNIGQLLRRIVEESDPSSWELDDIIVIASGCTDGTVSQAQAVRQAGHPVRIIEQERREGKASAINLGLKAARHNVILLASGDIMPEPGAIRALLRRMQDPTIGAVGGRPVPLNDTDSFTGFATHLLWRLHDRISAASPDNPKCGEMIAFRRALRGRPIVPEIPTDSAVDEVSIQAQVSAAGLRSAYASEAIVHNWGPSTFRDWFAQRRRINAGHILSTRQGFSPSTMRTTEILRAVSRDPVALRHPLRLAAVASTELVARIWAHVDIARGHSHTVWTLARTTKRAIQEELPD